MVYNYNLQYILPIHDNSSDAQYDHMEDGIVPFESLIVFHGFHRNGRSMGLL
jgi:hypothetical protein